MFVCLANIGKLFGYSTKLINKVYEQSNVYNLFCLFCLLINKVHLYLPYTFKTNIMETEKRYNIIDREAGNVIDCFITLSEALKQLLDFEKDDKANGIFTENFYQIKEIEILKNY